MLDLFDWIGGRRSDPSGTDRSPSDMLQSIAKGGRRFDRLVFTQNRRVMASVTEGGRTLRIHQSFAGAPPEVLGAIGALFAARSGHGRTRARAVVRDYLASAAPPPSEPRRPRVSRPRPSDLPHIERLQEEFRAVNRVFFASALPDVPIRLSGRMRRRNGHFSPDPLEIAISRQLCLRAVDGEAMRTLRHEMIHLWQWVEKRKLGHGPEFRAWARLLDIHPRATRTVCWLASADQG